ncbi:MAG: type II toxin-antitoxin system mRNA interferase toxin, RelE/StbE family [Deltaproteobacteria bacterium HGW-Deltaproteobacteria-13]|jgi:mRNA interferase RelE/StbE|nr:MAG: type II toxin-antitoxin system mRNA interferase toxin, RelE/StbE family [Deltaproteobacteria bacterium HGW-Deltaproteobacteria-13]
MKHIIEFSQEAASDVDKLFYADKKLFARVLKKIESLTDNPHEGKALTGNHKGEFSLRIGAYRIVYELDTSGRVIFILTIKHRKHVY